MNHQSRYRRANRLALLLTIALLSLSPDNAGATELVYVPINPNFGGNPLNGPMLLNNAQSQNKYEDEGGTPTASGYTQKTPLQQFNENLQRSILNRLSQAVTGGIVSDTGELVPGTIETTDFIIVIADLGGGVLQITTTDKATGESTSFQVNSTL